jgi:hypothetical protein
MENAAMSSMRRQWAVGVFALCLALGHARAYVAIVNKVDHEQIHIVPAPGPVTIDGDLGDWDLSGAILMFLDEGSKATYSVRGALMYGDDYLYVGARIKDPTPMVNRYAFGGQVNMSWNADAIQLRIVSNPEVRSSASLQTGGHMSEEEQRYVNHITLWYSMLDEAAGYAATYTLRFRDQVLNPPGVRGAYRQDADGQGYTLEYRIPWAVLRAPRPLKAGDTIQLQWQAHWGNDQGTEVRWGMTDVRSRDGSKDLGYMGPRSWGLGLFEAEGNLALSERTAVGRAEGHIPIAFNLERDGKVSLAIRNQADTLIRTVLGAQPYAAGDHTFLWDGLDDYDRPLPAGMYTAHFLMHDGVGQRYVANVGVSGTPPYQTEDGTGGWAGDYRNPQYMATDGERMYLGTASAEAAPVTIATDLDGRKLFGIAARGGHLTLHNGFGYFISQGGGQITKFDAVTGLLSPFSTGRPESTVTAQREGESGQEWGRRAWLLHAVAVYRGMLLVTSEADNLIHLLDLESGEPRGDLPIEAPVGLLAAPDGTLYAVSGDALGRYDFDAKRFSPLIEKLDRPRHLAIDAAGHLYVSLQGETMQVWQIAPDGQVVRRFGKPGGRPERGAFDPSGMLRPQGIAICPNGRLWVAEADDQPKRYSVWNPDGSLWKDFFGSQNYATTGYINPAKPEYVFAQSVRYRVNYDSGEWAPDCTIVRAVKEMGVELTVPSVHGGAVFVNHANRTFLFVPPMTVYEEIADGEFVPRMNMTREGRQSRLWIDDNNDGLVQEEEIRSSAKLWSYYWTPIVDQHMNLYDRTGAIWSAQGGTRSTEPYGILKWSFQGFNEEGGLVYGDPAEAERIVNDPDGGRIGAWYTDGDGSDLYALVSGGSLDRGVRAQGSGHRVARFSSDGRKVWEYHNVHCAFAWTSENYFPGYLVGALVFSRGATKDLIGVTGYYGQYFLLDKETGLFVDALGEDQRSAYTLDHHMVLTENFNGTLYERDGKTYFIGGDADLRVWELTGLETIRRSRLEIEITPEQAMTSEAASRQNFLAQQSAIGRQTLTLPRLRGAAADGRYDEWSQAPVLTLVMQSDRTAQVQAGYDHGNLYLLYQVRSDSPFLNTPTDPRLLFKSGSSVEIQLGVDREARQVRGQNRQEMRAGDLRLILARSADGKTVATRYRWKVAGDEKPRQHTFESPTGEETVEEVMPLDTVALHHASGDGSYTIEVAIPWSELGVEPTSGLTLGGDFGIVFGNVGGTRNAIRHMWSDKSPEVSINNDIPSEVRIHPNQWGTWMLE